MDANEAKVKAAWEHIGMYGYGGATRYVYLAVPCREFSGIDEPAAWAAAAEFTAARQQKIAELDEEIALLEVDVRRSDSRLKPILTRILTRLQAARAELTRGMVTPQPKESA